MVSEYGADKFQAALWSLCRSAKFCPVPGEIRERLEEMNKVDIRPEYFLPAAIMEPPKNPVTPEEYQEFKQKFTEIVGGKKMA